MRRSWEFIGVVITSLVVLTLTLICAPDVSRRLSLVGWCPEAQFMIGPLILTVMFGMLSLTCCVKDAIENR